MHAMIKSEKGMALLMALGAIVIIGVMIGGIVFVSTQDYRIGGNTVRQARAAAAAELGLNRLPQDWNLADNQRLKAGDTLTKSYTAPRGASVKVTVTKVSGVTFWAVSEGTAGALGSQASARRRYGTLFKLDMPQMNFMGAITTQGNTTVNGNVTVNGNDAPPAGWAACGPTAPPVAGAAISPTTTATVNGSVSLSGSPPVLTTPAAGDTNTYFNYGNSSYQSLAAAATLTYAGGTLLNGVGPLVVGGVCQASLTPPNWGEPTHATPAGACDSYFPIIHVLGDLKVTTGRGQGILLVDGDFTVAGNFTFDGAVIARGGLKMTGTGNKISGAVMAASVDVNDNVALAGNTSLLYSSCALIAALSASAYPKQAKERGWVDVY
jgi:cytoskeletal protein CcmA (bactofilin family)